MVVQVELGRSADQRMRLLSRFPEVEWASITHELLDTTSILIVAADQLFADILDVCVNRAISHYSATSVTAKSVHNVNLSGADIAIVQYQSSGASTISLMDVIQEGSDASIIVVDLPEVPEYALRCFEAGAQGCIKRSDSIDHLLEAVRTVEAGQPYVGDADIQPLLARLINLKQQVSEFRLEPAEPLPLSKREVEVMEELVKGSSNAEIAEVLFVAVGTVKNHVHKIMQKLHARDRRHACYIYSNLNEK